jgi:SAM-dependent methyltransferase
MLDVEAVTERLRAELAPARSMESLIEDAAPLYFAPGDIVLDIGAGRGRWSRPLAERYRCRVVPIDVSFDQHPEAVADIDALPLDDSSVDGIWCRDMLEMVDDPHATLCECFRVLRPGRGMLLYVPFMTERMSSLERDELLLALGSATWWGEGCAQSSKPSQAPASRCRASASPRPNTANSACSRPAT